MKIDLVQDALEFIVIGLDHLTLEVISSTLHKNKIAFNINSLNNSEELDSYKKKKVDAIFFYSNRLSQKTLDTLRKIHHSLPHSSVVLLSHRAEMSGVLSAFRAGIFDFLSLPLDKEEVYNVVFRLKIHGALQKQRWTPERAVLNVFSRPENFRNIEDIYFALKSYFKMFFEIEKEIDFNPSEEDFESLRREFKLNNLKFKKVKDFIADNSGFIFGLRFVQNRCFFLLKKSQNKIIFLQILNYSEFNISDILNSYLADVIKTTLKILNESSAHERMRILSVTDEVTGLFNQRKLHEDLDLYMSRFPHTRQGFCLLFIDIDYFKNVNDNFGHVIGSKILIDMAKVLLKDLRNTDLIYRYGGDEFIILLPQTELEIAKKIAARVSVAVKASIFDIGNKEHYKMSLSIGIAEFPTDAKSAKEIINFADKMMYLSKKSGRGKVFHISEVET